MQKKAQTAPIEVTEIDFNPDLFNNIYWHLRDAFMNILIRFIWVYGGSSASKTYSVVQLIITSMMENENENTMVLRKYAVDIKDTIYSDFVSIIKLWELEDYFLIQQNYIRCLPTGSYIRFRGLDDSEKIKGLSNFKRVVLEEVSQFDQDDLKQVRKRLRGKVGQQIIGIFNPISEQHWIKTEIFDKETLIEKETDIAGMWVNEKGNLLVLKTNYLDNKYIVGPNFVDQHAIDDFEHDKLHDANYYRVYGLGDWGKLRTGGEFWKDFDPNRDCIDARWIEDAPLHISWDENVNPFITCLVWQLFSPALLNRIEEGQRQPNYQRWGLNPWDKLNYLAMQIDEICLPDPRNRTRDACAEFAKRFPVGRCKGLYVYGDRTSIKEDTKLEKGENFFTQILGYLRDYKPTLRMQSVNPSVKQSKDFINDCYTGRGKVQIWIGANCKKSKYDYEYALEDSDGTLKKTKVINKTTKVSFEEFGHPSDAKRYILTVAFAEQFQLYLRNGRNTKPMVGGNVSKNAAY